MTDEQKEAVRVIQEEADRRGLTPTGCFTRMMRELNGDAPTPDRQMKCKDCRWLTGKKSIIGIDCENPVKQGKWRTGTAHTKHPHDRACKAFEAKEETESVEQRTGSKTQA